MKISFSKLFYGYIIASLIVPSYFATRIGGSFLLNCQRIIELGLILFLLCFKYTCSRFVYSFKHCRINMLILIYLFICAYTAIINSSVNSFLGPFIDIFTVFYLSLYAFHTEVNDEKIIRIIKACITIVALASIFQFLTGINLFAILDTCGEISVENSIRDENVRCSGPYAHALVLDMVIIMVVPFLCIDKENNSLYLYKNPIQLLVLTVTVFFSGARSGIAIFLTELLAILIMSRKNVRGKTWFYTISLITILGLLIITFIDTPIVQYFIRYFYYIVDEVFGTSFALNYGGDISIKYSSDARDVLWKIISSSQFNKFVGKGTSYSLSFYIGSKLVVSVDNWYMLQYIYYALPGLFMMIIIFVKSIKNTIRLYRSTRNSVFLASLIAIIGYLCNLAVAAAFNTMTYFFIILAYIYAKDIANEEKK